MDIAACAAAQDGPQKLPCSVSIVNVCDRLPVLPLLLWRVGTSQEHPESEKGGDVPPSFVNACVGQGLHIVWLNK